MPPLKSPAKRPWPLNAPLTDKARPPKPWLLRGVDLDSVLAISVAERRRWIQEGRVPAVGQYSGRLPNGIRYWGTLHDPEVVKALRPRVPEWLAERKAELARPRREQRQTGKAGGQGQPAAR